MQLGNLEQCLFSVHCHKLTNILIHLAAGTLQKGEVVLLTHRIEGLQKRIPGND